MNATIVTSFSTFSANELTLYESIIEIETTINVIVIHEIDANDNEKFLITPLNESLIFLPNILQTFMLICSFLIIF